MATKVDMEERKAAIGKEIPEVMKALGGLHEEVMKDGALSAKTKELMLVAMAVALKCEYCLWNHVPIALKMGATREEIMEAVSTAILISGGTAVAYGSAVVLEILDELNA